MTSNLAAVSLLVIGLMIVLSNCEDVKKGAKQSADEVGPNDDGAGDATLDAGDVGEQDELVDNPDVTRKRVFYKLYKSTTGTCYLLPRPDNEPTALDECAKSTDLGEKFLQYQVCDENPDPDVINGLPCEVGIQFSTFLNNALEFTADHPYPGIDDRVAACEVEACAGAAEVADYCAYYKDQADKMEAGLPIPAIAREDTETERARIAACLSEVYGPASPPADLP